MPASSVKLTFLPWIVDKQENEHEKQLQDSRRHQHTALAGHRRHREQRRKLRTYKSPDQLPQSATNASRDVTRWTVPISDNDGFTEPTEVVLLNPTMNLFGDLELSPKFKRHFNDGKTAFRFC